MTDFGVAKILDAQQDLTSTGMMVGSPWYMSPEQCGVGELCPASDIFSLGSTVFELLSGRTPFTGNTTAAVVRQITLDEAPRVGVAVPGLPQPIEDFVSALMAKELRDRYDSAAHVMVDSQLLQKSQPPKWLPSARHAAPDPEPHLALVDELLDGSEAPKRLSPSASNAGVPWRALAIGAMALLGFGLLFLAFGGGSPGEAVRPANYSNPPPPPPPEVRLPPRFDDMDKDRDGVLSLTEALTDPNMNEERFNRRDINGDRHLDPEELPPPHHLLGPPPGQHPPPRPGR